jgi:hypothetical protein
MAKVQRLKVRLFVEGVEIPCVSIQVQSAPNSPNMASIQIPPLAEGTSFLPRSIVHAFFLDFYEDENPNLKKTGTANTKKPGPSVYEKVAKREVVQNGVVGSDYDDIQANYDLNKYKLLFCGELMGFQWTKNAINRSLVLQCADMSNYWDYAYQFNNTDIFGPGMKAMFSGGATNLFTDFLSSPGEMVTKVLFTPSNRYPNLKGILGGIIHLLEAIGGSYYTEKKFAGQNVFFSLAELRLHITQMLTAYDKDPTSHKLLGGSYDDLFGRSIGNLGDQASFRKIISMLSSTIFHEVYGQPCPMYSPGSSGTVSGFVRKKAYDIPELGAIVADAKKNAESLDTASISMADTDGIDLSAGELIKRNNGFIELMSAAQQMCRQSARKAGSAAADTKRRTTAQVAGVASRIAKVLKSCDLKLSKVIAQLQSKKGKTKTSAFIATSTITLVEQVRDELLKIGDFEATVTKVGDAVPASLKQQIFRPDVWFSAPPRCNVLFPDNYTTCNYTRQFMAEPTRLLLKTHDEFFGEDELFDNFYFAPKAITVKGQKKSLAAILKNDLMDHELFTGILPVFEKMGEFNIFAARSGMVDGKMPKVGLAQRSTNFLYFKYRFASRQLQISGKFNPYVACGFPGLIIDKYVDLDTLKLHNTLKKSLPEGANYQSKIPNLLGTHFLANFTDVTHQIDQQQGTTNINCSYARQAEESVEFLGVQQEEVSEVIKKKGAMAVRTTEVAAITPPRVGQQGPNQGRITSVVETTSKFRMRTLDNSAYLPLYGGPRDKKTRQLTERVPVNIPGRASEFGAEAVKMAGDPNIVIRFKSFDVTETKEKELRETVFLPVEEYVRPGWYGDCWHPSKIADVYYDFFNIGSITEPMQVNNADGKDTTDTSMSSDALQMLADARENSSFDFARDQLITLSQKKESSVQDAVAFLVLTYSIMRHAGFDTEQFIRSYTWRPIATLLDMFGSRDLKLDTNGREVVSGFEGFHSRAFGPFDDLFGLVTNEIESIVGIKKGSNQAQKGDTRKRKLQAVLDYIAVLKLSRAILG